jgi:hypothetical protein
MLAHADQRALVPDPGATFNPYDFFGLDRAYALQIWGGADRWVADAARTQEILRTIDVPVVLEPHDASASPPTARHFELLPLWPNDAPPLPEASSLRWWFVVDVEGGVMAHPPGGVQWRIPDAFLSCSNGTPAPASQPSRALLNPPQPACRLGSGSITAPPSWCGTPG